MPSDTTFSLRRTVVNAHVGAECRRSGAECPGRTCSACPASRPSAACSRRSRIPARAGAGVYLRSMSDGRERPLAAPSDVAAHGLPPPADGRSERRSATARLLLVALHQRRRPRADPVQRSRRDGPARARRDVSELRFNELRGEEVVYAIHRQDRTFLPDPRRTARCAPPGPAGRRPRSRSRASRSSSSTTASRPSRRPHGAAEVVVYTDDHDGSFGAPAAGARRGADVGLAPPLRGARRARGRRLRVHLRKPRRRGRASRCTTPTGRSTATRSCRRCRRSSWPPTRVSAAARRARCSTRELRRRHGACSTRTSAVVAYVPEAARWPYEVARRDARAPPPACSHCEPGELRAAGRARCSGWCAAIDALFARPFPYVMAVHQAPTARRGRGSDGHLHVEFYPPLRTAEKLKYLAGSEQGAGTFISDVAARGVRRSAARGDRPCRLERVTRLRARARQPDRRAHRLQRRARAAVRDRRGDHGQRAAPPAGRGRGRERVEAIALDLGERDEFLLGRAGAAAAAGARSCAARSRELQRAGWRAAARRAAARSAATCRAAPGCPPRRRSRSRCAWRCSSSARRAAAATAPDRARAGAAVLARGERLGGRAAPGCSTSSPSCAASARARRADRLPRASRSSRCRCDSAAGGCVVARLGRAPRARELRLQRAPRGVRARVRAARRRARCAKPTQRALAELPEPLRTPRRATCSARTRACSRPCARAAGAATCPRSARCSTPRTRACATSTRSRRPRSRPRSRGCASAGAAGARMIGGGFGGSVLGLFAPEASRPPGAREVRPGAGRPRAARPALTSGR